MWVASFLSKGKKMYMFCHNLTYGKKEAEVGIILLTKEVLLKITKRTKQVKRKEFFMRKKDD